MDTLSHVSVPSQRSGVGKVRKNATQSCDHCRSRRVRCLQDRAHPGRKCQRCEELRIPCTFFHRPEKRGPQAGKLMATNARLLQLESTVKALTQLTAAAGLDTSSITALASEGFAEMEGMVAPTEVDAATTLPSPEQTAPYGPSVTWGEDRQITIVPRNDAMTDDAVFPDNATNDADGTESEWATASRMPSEVGRGFSGLILDDSERRLQGYTQKDQTGLHSMLHHMSQPSSPPMKSGLIGGMTLGDHAPTRTMSLRVSPPAPSPVETSSIHQDVFPLELLPTMLPIFFHFIGHYLPCIHPATFSTRTLSYYANNSFLMSTIFAVTWTYHSSAHPDKAAAYPHLTSETFLSRARTMLLDVLERPVIENVWGLLFYVLGISTRSTSQSGEAFLGAAIGMARHLGLHEDPPNESHEYGSPGWVQAEERRRTFISLWKLDMFWSAGLQIPWMMERYPAEKLRLAVSDRIWMPSVFIDKPPRYRAVVGKIGALESSGMPENYGLVWYDAVVGSRSLPRELAWKELYRLRETHSDLFPPMTPLPTGPTIFLDNGLLATVEGQLVQMQSSEQYPLANIKPTRQYLYDYAGLSISGRLVWHVMVGASLLKANNEEERLKNALEGIELVLICVEACKAMNFGWVDLGFPTSGYLTSYLANQVLDIYATRKAVAEVRPILEVVVSALDGFGKRWPYSMGLASALAVRLAAYGL
ncbi:hypothetical protein M427DRAFT_151989 [Gonapodya prolifera JEL478]|uniref:Zn(2)-C6 fungal-type domain-containing protein n=1 Tax=Gonapodya prolifera (strain JEL478) TaxID=1344416 RepID=A0A139ATI3_GONPJ|nr:hypothetical protein M427DRAFT_151989 [Gonapodya prolifera JEL478]|eukprot:KXS20038.1 hypothetical protein M427DRAFT_151989 [Gonapodya prolifera JEL478]